MKLKNQSLLHYLFLAFAETAALTGSILAAPITWDTANATSTSWALGSNWIGGVAPVNGDDVVVSANGTFAPTDYNGVEVNSLTLTGSTTLSLNGLKVGAGGVSNTMTVNSLFLTGTTTLLANQTWSGTRTIFVTKVAGASKIVFEGSGLRFDSSSPDWSGGLDVRTSANMGNAGYGAGAISPYGTGTITLINRKLDDSTTNPWLGFAGHADNNSPATANIITNPITLSGTSTGNFTLTQSNDAFPNVPHYYVLSGNITGAVDPARTLNFTNTKSSPSATPATFILSGTNTYAAATNIGSNTTLVLASTAAKSSGIVTASSASSSIGLGVGGAGYYSAANVGSLFNTNNLTGFSLASGSGVAIDTSNAGGSFNQTTALTAARSLTKLGTGTLEMSQTNTYSGNTNVDQGTLAVTGTGSINGTSGITVESGARFLYTSSVMLTQSVTLNGNGSANRAVLGGSGPIGASVALDNLGDVLSPGNSLGIQEFAISQNWSSLTYDWEINDFTGITAGTAFDLITINGTLTLDLSNDYGLNLLSLAGLATGDAANFYEMDRSWDIITTTGGISGFNADNWLINSTGFTNNEAGSWSLAATSNNLVLSYTAIPEPGAALLASLGMLVLLRRRRC